MKLLWVTGLLPEAVKLIREIVRAVKAGDKLAAVQAAERAAIVQGFRRAQMELRK